MHDPMIDLAVSPEVSHFIARAVAEASYAEEPFEELALHRRGARIPREDEDPE